MCASGARIPAAVESCAMSTVVCRTMRSIRMLACMAAVWLVLHMRGSGISVIPKSGTADFPHTMHDPMGLGRYTGRRVVPDGTGGLDVARIGLGQRVGVGLGDGLWRGGCTD